jgi:hypothetical protein
MKWTSPKRSLAIARYGSSTRVHALALVLKGIEVIAGKPCNGRP